MIVGENKTKKPSLVPIYCRYCTPSSLPFSLSFSSPLSAETGCTRCLARVLNRNSTGFLGVRLEPRSSRQVSVHTRNGTVIFFPDTSVSIEQSVRHTIATVTRQDCPTARK